MKPDAVEDSVFLPESSVKVIRDEVADGEYGLVINGHSLVRHKTFPYNARCDCPFCSFDFAYKS